MANPFVKLYQIFKKLCDKNHEKPLYNFGSVKAKSNVKEDLVVGKFVCFTLSFSVIVKGTVSRQQRPMLLYINR